MDEEGEFPLSFCIKGKHDKPQSYGMLRKKTQQLFQQQYLPKYHLKTKITNIVLKI